MKTFNGSVCINQYYKRLACLLRMAFYAVARGKTPGVYHSWEECSKEVSGFHGAVYKKFGQEKDALEFIQRNRSGLNSASRNSENNILISAAADNRINSLKSPVTSNGTSSMKRKSSTDRSESSSSQVKVRVMERLQAMQDKLEAACNMFKDLVNEVKSIKEELSNGSQTPRKAILIDIEDASNLETSSSSFHVACTSSQRPEDQQSSGGKPSNVFKVDSEGFVEVYTDGACTNNGYSRAKAGVGVWFGDGHSLNVSEPVKGRVTNNSAEIEAVTLAILHAKGADSSFLINAITKWIKNWKRNNWKTANGEPVKNKDELILLDKVKEGIEVKFVHVSGHVGIHGNEAADALARAGAEKYIPTP
ncbi:hypothetical protein J437_LFUL005170 [Ladona fulva]|uniref:Ribonuclease H1 n=1 Tax=Ladona fulva TaxID=123851 RepID=A0A8K0P9N0_LADFU|nr:hypothetical protein J437_LFUL005170 [Ladona fulva]